MPDPTLPKEDFNRYVDRHDHQHAELDGRLARDMVPMSMYIADQRSQERRLTTLEHSISDGVARHDRDIALKADTADVALIDRRIVAIEQRPANMRNYLIALAGLALTLLGIVVSAYFSSRGSS
jgi:hypothetical protein